MPDHERGKEPAREKDDRQDDTADAPHGCFKQMLHRFVAGIVGAVDMVGDEVEMVGSTVSYRCFSIVKVFSFPMKVDIIFVGTDRDLSKLGKVFFVSVGINRGISLCEEEEVLIGGNHGNKGTAHRVFRVIQVAWRKIMAADFSGARAFGHGFQIQIIAAAAQDEAPTA